MDDGGHSVPELRGECKGSLFARSLARNTLVCDVHHALEARGLAAAALPRCSSAGRYYRFVFANLSDIPSIAFAGLSHDAQDVAEWVGPLSRQHATAGCSG
jgi:hypothetical protein